MKYESEFKIKEKEFRPRKNFKHDQVIEELANIVKRADLEIEELNKACYNGSNELDRLQDELNNSESREVTILIGLSLSALLNAIFIYNL